jgi:CRP-like cAMP-binding protein
MASIFNTQNLILSALPTDVRSQLLSKLEPISLRYAEVLYEIDDPVDYVYFLNSGMVSLISSTQDGQSLEVGIVGYEGYVGLPIFLQDTMSPYRMVVQAEGTALRMRVDGFKAMCDQHGSLQELLHRYGQSLIREIMQSALCICFHHLEARFCRWLLICQDNVKSDEFHLTQEFLADMLGVRRAGVTVAAGAIQNEGLISYNRGRITILDRKGLEAACCECYKIIRQSFDWLHKHIES